MKIDCHRVAFINHGHIVADDTPRHLELAHGKRTFVVTVSDAEPGTAGDGGLIDMTLSMDDPRDQARLAQLLARGVVRAVHSQEATLEDVFFEVASVRPSSEERSHLP
jgi:ABC-type multidrug transport system ATPase subunit